LAEREELLIYQYLEKPTFKLMGGPVIEDLYKEYYLAKKIDPNTAFPTQLL